jgi:hypothetical protein
MIRRPDASSEVAIGAGPRALAPEEKRSGQDIMASITDPRIARVLSLQRLVGNRATAKLIATRRSDAIACSCGCQGRCGRAGCGSVDQTGRGVLQRQAEGEGPESDTGQLSEVFSGGGTASGTAAGADGHETTSPGGQSEQPDSGSTDAGNTQPSVAPPGDPQPLFVGGRHIGDLLGFVELQGDADRFLSEEALERLLEEGEDAVVGETEVVTGEAVVAAEAGEKALELAVAVPVAAVGVLVGVGVAVGIPVLIAHADEVRKRLAECGGTLAPGGVERCVENQKCSSCSDGELTDGPGVHQLVLDSLPENGTRWFERTRFVPVTRSGVLADRRKFITATKVETNNAVLIACSCSGVLRARTLGFKFLGDIPHAEEDALPELRAQVRTWPFEERQGGALGATARSDVCRRDERDTGTACTIRLRLAQQELLPRGRLALSPGARFPPDYDARATEAYNDEWEALTGRRMPDDWRSVS